MQSTPFHLQAGSYEGVRPLLARLALVALSAWAIFEFGTSRRRSPKAVRARG